MKDLRKLFGCRLEEYAWDILNDLEDRYGVPAESEWYQTLAHKIQFANTDAELRASIREMRDAHRKNCIFCDPSGNLIFQTSLVVGKIDFSGTSHWGDRGGVFKG